MTLGQEWDQLLAYAEHAGLKTELALCIDTFSFLEYVSIGITSLFNECDNPLAQGILEGWTENPTAHRFKILINTAISQKWAKDIPAPDYETTHLKSKLRMFYMFALIKKPTPKDLDPKITQTIQCARIWLIIQALIRTERGISHDVNVRRAANRIRELSDTESGKGLALQDNRKLILDLFSSDHAYLSFSGFNSFLCNRCDTLKPLNRGNKKNILFLNAIRDIASNKDSRDKGLQKNIEKKLFSPPNLDSNSTNSSSISSLPTTESELDESSEDIVAVYEEVNAKHSFAYQKLEGVAPLLTKSELYHHLPWTYDRLAPPEIKHLFSWINSALEQRDPLLSLLGVLTNIAILTARTLVQVLNLPISEKLDAEWSMHPSTFMLVRRPPKRQHSWEPDQSNPYIWDHAHHNQISLTDSITSILANLNLSAYDTLGTLWDTLTSSIHARHAPADIEQTFISHMEKDSRLRRIRSGMLANTLSMMAFDQSGNCNFPTLISTHPRTALPGMFAYGAWSSTQLHSYTGGIQSSDRQSNTTVAIGCHLAPLENYLIETIHLATWRIQGIDLVKDPIRFHNAYVNYVTTALWAATGVRPFSDVFESFKQFNFKRSFVFVREKAAGHDALGRLVPIPETISTYLDKTYFQHLTHLRDALITLSPELSRQISRLLAKSNADIPLFFYIDNNTLNWASVSPRSLDEDAVFKWELPDNLFRHRFAKSMTNQGIDQEIVNAWLGHTDSGLGVYSDYSARCFQENMDANRLSFTSVYERLGFELPNTWEQPPQIDCDSPKYRKQNFGSKAREDLRKKNELSIINAARKEIEIICNDRALQDLTDAEIEEIQTIMLFHENGMFRSSTGFIRYQVFDELIEKVWQDTGRKFSIKNRLSWHKPEGLIYSIKTATAVDHFTILRDQFSLVFKELEVSRTSKIRCSLLAVISLIFEQRITYVKMLLDIYHGQHFRLTKYDSVFHLDYSEELDPEDFLAPIQRHAITCTQGRLLDRILSNEDKKAISTNVTPGQLGEIFNEQTGQSVLSAEGLIRQCCKIADHANKVELPGIVRAFLSGTVKSCSLSWHDIIRLEKNEILIISGLNKHHADNPLNQIIKETRLRYRSSLMSVEPENDPLHFNQGITTSSDIPEDDQKTDAETLLQNARVFLTEIHECLNSYQPSTNKATAKAVKQIISNYQHHVSTSILLLGCWVEHLVLRGHINKNADYSRNTVKNYFSALKESFLDLFYTANLLAMDRDDVTELYEEFLAVNKHKKGPYHANRLIDFHNFVSTQGVEDPDWEELDLPTATRMVSPGIVTEKDYLSSLSVIGGLKSLDRDYRLKLKFLLFLTYRFGLRRKEAVGLKRRDFFDEDLMYVAIQSNYARPLKTKCSRRLVPLMFPLQPQETRIIEEMKRRHASHFGDDLMSGLFSDETKKSLPMEWEKMSSILISVLKQVTGNPKTVLHHCRHTFSNLTAMSIYQLQFAQWKKLPLNKNLSEQIRKTSLGVHTNISRRSSACAARLLGHSHPRTDQISYQHFIADWASELTGHTRNRLKTTTQLKHAINLEEKPRKKLARIRHIQSAPNTFTPRTLLSILQFMALISYDKSIDQAATIIGFSTESKDLIECTLKNIGSTIILDTSNGIRPDTKKYPLEWLKRISGVKWRALFKMAERYDRKAQTDGHTSTLPPKGIHSIIGRRKHITLWDESHFIHMKEFIKFYDLNGLFAHQYYGENDQIEQMAKRHQLEPPNRTDHLYDNLDAGREKDGPNSTHHDRLNLIFQRHSKKGIVIRNKTELLTLLAADTLANSSLPF